MKEILVLVIAFFFMLAANPSSAQNPIVPSGVFMADPEAHVWADGKIYIYGSRDESDDYWCSYSYHVLSSSNMQQWDIDEDVFSSKGGYDGISQSNERLFAPDCAYLNGKYYLYYCTPDWSHGEGVAVGQSPIGPFEDGKVIANAHEIDPAVLIEEDGSGYYLWGQHEPKMARLTSDILAIDTLSITRPLDQSKGKVFHEGSSIRKIGSQYYLVFADESRNGRPTCLGYATSHKPMGPYQYQGVIIDNIGSDPEVWNNHGSIEEYEGKWYVFYHRPTNGSQKFRKVCVEPIHIDSKGKIAEVEMTSQGAGKPLSAKRRIEAERACTLFGNVRVEDYKGRDQWHGKLAKMKTGDIAAYKYIDFERGYDQMVFKVLSSSGAAEIEVWADSLDTGLLLGVLQVDEMPVAQPFAIAKSKIEQISSVHAVYLRMKSELHIKLEIDWIEFASTSKKS